MPGLYVEVFPGYGNASAPPVLPIPGGLRPARVATAPNVSYASASSGGVFTLAGATTYFGLRFSGEEGSGADRRGGCRFRGSRRSQGVLFWATLRLMAS